MKFTKIELLWTCAFLMIGLAYIFGLFVDLTGDSGLYAAISRQMVDSGDWFNLQLNGKPYDQKPHLFFWLAGAGIQLFGNTNFAFKLFPFLYGISGIYFTYRLGKTIYSNEVGKVAALIVATSQISFLYFFDFHMDSILQTGVVLALWQLAEYLKFKKKINFVIGFVGVGLAMFSKGPVGAVIPFLAVLFYLLSERDFKQIFHAKWVLGIIIVLLIISPSLYHLHKNFGTEGIKFFFITNNFGRITGEYAGSNSDPLFYLHTLLWAFLPWALLVVLGMFSEIESWIRKGNLNSWGYYLLGSTLVLLLVLSIAKGKAPNYFLIAVAPIAVVAGKSLEQLNLRTDNLLKRILYYQQFFVGLLGLFILILIIMLSNKIMLPLLIVSISSVFIFYSFRILKVKIVRIVFISVLTVSVLNLILATSILPDLYKYQAARNVLKVYNENRNSNDKLFNYHSEDYELFFYAEDQVEQIYNYEDYNKMLENKGTWLHTIKNGYHELIDGGRKIDTVYFIPYKGMNNLNLRFLNPKTREAHLDTTYLIRVN